jgi:CRISPR-associated protein Cas2
MAYFVICYDIADDKRRERVVKLLEDTGGVRVQYSIFELRLPKAKLRRLLTKLGTIISSREDSLITYELCATCQTKIVRQGQGSVPQDEPVIVA